MPVVVKMGGWEGSEADMAPATEKHCRAAERSASGTRSRGQTDTHVLAHRPVFIVCDLRRRMTLRLSVLRLAGYEPD